MGILHTLGNSIFVRPVPYFVLDDRRLGECRVVSGDDFEEKFLGKREKVIPELWLQLYWLDREVEHDELRAALGVKLRIFAAHLHQLLCLQIHGQEGWLPAQDENIEPLLHMENKDGDIELVEILYSRSQKRWIAGISDDEEALPAGTIIMAQANAL